jgi:hypothetical protein
LSVPGRPANRKLLPREIRRLFSQAMKSLALWARLRARHRTTLAQFATAWALCLGCESKGATDGARPAAPVKVHPPFAVPKTAEMLPELQPQAASGEHTLPSKPRDKKDWQANCKIQRACSPESQSIAVCDPGVPQRPWVDVVSEGDVVLERDVAVSGTIGLSLLKKTGSGPCAPGACCHTLEMQIVLVGEPTGSLPLRGLTCSGDDSILCCSVPTEGQAVVARGRLQKAPGVGSKWQLANPTLCLLDNTPRH